MNSRPVQSPPRFISLQTGDFEELGLTLLRWRHQVRKLDRGTFVGQARVLHLGTTQILHIQTNQKLHVQGCTPVESIAFSPVLPGNADAVWRGRRLTPGQMSVVAPDQDLSHVTGVNYETLALVADGKLIRRLLTDLGRSDPEEFLSGNEVFVPPPQVFSELGPFLLRLLSQAETDPGWLTRADLTQVERECSRRFVEAVMRGRPTVGPRGRSVSQANLVCQAEDYVWAHPPGSVSVVDLCRELGVSERTLYYAFRDLRGLGPVAYFKVHRLNAVREELRRSHPQEATVHDIAVRWGFLHMGEFAADYHRLFGESPADTLRGRSRSFR